MRRLEERRLKKARTTLLSEAGESGAECLAWHLGPVEGEILVAVTDDRLLWTLLHQPDLVVEMSIENIHDVERAGFVYRVTERDSRPMFAQRGWLSATGELKLAFELPQTEEGEAFRKALDRALAKRAPFYAKKRARAEGLRERQDVPVRSWRDCPFCGEGLTSRADGAVGCSDCLRCFCDPGLEPVVSQGSETYGRVVGTQPWRPEFPAQMRMAGRTTSWLVRPRDQPMGPSVFPEIEILELIDLLG